MATTLLVNGQPSKPLSSRPATRAGGVRKRGESREQMKQRLGYYDNSDIEAIFNRIQETRGMVRRGLSGAPLNADGTDPINSFDQFIAKNPHRAGAASRQQQYDQQALGNPSSAVAERRALQEMQQPNPNLVTGNDGYRTLFGPGGKVLGTTKPMARTSDNAINRGTATGAERDQFSQQLQQTGMSSASSPKGLDMLFPGNAKSSPPGGASGGRVGPPQAPGEPGGDTLFGQMPDTQSDGMPMPKAKASQKIQYGPRQPVDQNGWENLFSKQPSSQPAMTTNPTSQPSVMSPNEGPQLQYGNQDQLSALRTIDARGPNPSSFLPPSAPSQLRFDMSNYFPGNDYDYLSQVFPGLNPDQILQLFQNPAYASQLR